MGYGDIGCYGHPTIATPNIDRMASEGMKFTQFHVASSVCTPSRTGFLTGRLPIRSGLTRVLIPQSTGGIPDEEITIAELLKGTGYATACMFYYFGEELWAVKKGPWKIHVKTTSPASVSTWGEWPIEKRDPPLLFHIEHDPSEKYNIADKNPDVVRKLLDVMKQHQTNLVAGQP